MNTHLPASAPRRNWIRRLVNLLVALAVIAVAAATFVFSYDGVHAIALLGGMSARLARYYPELFDAVLVIACVATVVLRDGRWWARAWAWAVLVVLLAAIGAADVLHAMNYTLRHRTTEGIVAAAPVVAVLFAFSLLLAVLRQTRSQVAVEEPGDRAERRPTVPAPLGLPALPAPPAADAAATVETQAVTGGPAIRPPAPPIALPAGPQTAPLTPPEGLPAMARAGTEPNEFLPPAAPPVASQRAPEGEPAPPTVSSAALTTPPPPAQAQSPAPAQSPAQAQSAEPASARPPGIRYAGSGAQVRAADEPGAAEPAAEPGAAAAEPGVPHEDYWDGDDAGQFAGLVYPAREGSPGPDAAAGDGSGDVADRAAEDDAEDDSDQAAGDEAGNRDDTRAERGAAPEIDEDAPPFATAPFATVPRLNRVRSLPAPPEDGEAE
jgi:Protein of unknown function (DUF2637)